VSDTLQYALFGFFAAVVLLPALLVVSVRNIVHAGFWLLPTFLGVAGLFVLLGADFLAAVQVLIYAGAIMLLLLFVLMLTRDAGDPQLRQTNRLAVWAGLSCALLAVVTVAVLTREPWAVSPAALAPGFTRSLGQALLGPYLLVFELASVLLLSAMVGAIVIARREGPR